MGDINFYYLFCIFAVSLASMILHELGHGLVALWQGDHTARLAGRLSLNPLRHIDPVMSVAVPLLLAFLGLPIFGGAKPVPINTRNLKHGEWSFALVAIAGPLVNFVLAFFFYGVYLFAHGDWLIILAMAGVQVNLGFMLFNIIPIPPLDGSRVLYALAPDGVRAFMANIERYGFVIIYVLLLLSGTLLTRYILAGSNMVEGWFQSFYGLFLR